MTVVCAVVALAMAASAQTIKAPVAKGPFRLIAVHATGSTHFPEADIVATTGLKLGTNVMPEDFRPIADKLLALGAFEEVSYEYGPAGTGIKLEFKVSDSPHLLPAGFDNFVWFTDQQLTDAVRVRVPLFHGEVPADGEMLAEVTDALQGVLAEKGIPGQVKFELQQEKLGALVKSGVFLVEGIAIKVRAVKFAGAPASETADLEKATKPLLEMPFQRATAETFTRYNFRPVLLHKGYLKAKFGEPAATLVANNPKQPVVDVTIPVEPGLQYRLGALRWTGNKAVQTFDLDKLLQVEVGRPADAVELEQDLNAVHELYVANGFLRQYTHAIATFDDSVQVVSYQLRVNEGDQYHLGSVDITGLEPRVRARVREEWKLREGDPYNPNYVKEFLHNARTVLAQGAITQVEPTIDEKTKTVDVTLVFTFQKRAK